MAAKERGLRALGEVGVQCLLTGMMKPFDGVHKQVYNVGEVYLHGSQGSSSQSAFFT